MSRSKTRDRAVIAVVLVAGLVWYAYGVSVGWETRRADSDIGRIWVIGRYLLAGHWRLAPVVDEAGITEPVSKKIQVVLACRP